MHSDITGARGDSRVVLDGSIPAGTEEVHGAARGPQAIPVGSGNATGRGLQASEGLGLVESAPTSRERGGRVARGPNRRPALQGQAERMIGILKKCLEGALTGKRCTMREMGTIMAEAAQMVNSRPIARSTGDPESGGPITPLHLLLGRASVEVRQLRFNKAPRLTQRLQFMEETKKQFWHKWMSQVFGGRMLSHKWTKKERDVAARDVVLLAEAENEDPTYRMGIVDSVKPGEDGHVRTVNIRYTNPGKEPGERSPPKITTRPIHKIAVIVPLDYVFEDDFGSRAGEPGLPKLTQAEASDPEEGVPAPPDPADQGTEQLKPAEETPREAGAGQSLGEAKEEAAGEPGPVAATKRGPGRPRKEVKPDADPGATQPAKGPEANERPRRQAAIRAEENMRRGKKKDPEAWPLLQARANQKWQQRRN